MRVTPIGIALTCDPLDRFVDVVADTNRATHDTTVANAGASAVAAAVSAGIDGADLEQAAVIGIEAARRAVRTLRQRRRCGGSDGVGTRGGTRYRR